MEIYGLLEQLHRRDAALIRVGQMFAQAAVLLRKIWDHQGFTRGNLWEIHGKSRILQVKCRYSLGKLNKLENHHFSGIHETTHGPLSTATSHYRRVYDKSKIESRWTFFGRSESRRLNLDMEKYVNSTHFDKNRIFEPRNWEPPIIVCSPATNWEKKISAKWMKMKDVFWKPQLS